MTSSHSQEETIQSSACQDAGCVMACTGSPWNMFWLVVYLPLLKNMSSSVGSIIPHIWKHNPFMFQSPPTSVDHVEMRSGYGFHQDDHFGFFLGIPWRIQHLQRHKFFPAEGRNRGTCHLLTPARQWLVQWDGRWEVAQCRVIRKVFFSRTCHISLVSLKHESNNLMLLAGWRRRLVKRILLDLVGTVCTNLLVM